MSFYGDSCLLGPGPKASSRRKVKNNDNNISISNWACKSPLDSSIYFTYAFLGVPKTSCSLRKQIILQYTCLEFCQETDFLRSSHC